MPEGKNRQVKGHRVLTAALEFCETALMGASFLATGLIMIVVLADVVLRYAFNAPLPWSHTLIGMYLMVAAFFLALADTLNRDGHIAIDIFQTIIPTRLNHLLLGVGFAASIVFVGVIGWLGFNEAATAYVKGERLYGSMPWPTWIPKAIMALGCGVLALRCLHRSVVHLASFATGIDLVSVRVSHEATEHAE